MINDSWKNDSGRKQHFDLKANFKSDDELTGEGELSLDVCGSSAFIAACLFHIIEEIGERSPKAVELATTKYYTKVLDL